MDEFLRCLLAIWTEEEVEFAGEFYRVPRSRVAPKPLQKPRPPITIGGYSRAVLRRAVTLADGFHGGNVPLQEVAPLVRELRQVAEAAGRDPATLEVVSRGAVRLHDTPQGPGRRPLWGTVAEIREDVGRYAEAGLTELFLDANFDPRNGDLPRVLDLMAALAPSAAAC